MAVKNENKDCRVPFKVDMLSRNQAVRYAHIIITKSGKRYTVEIPDNVRFRFASVVRWLSTDESQENIAKMIREG